jgi:hypothetical protein
VPDRLGDPEVGDLDRAVGCEEDVRRLNVSVQDAAGVGRSQRTEQLTGKPANALSVERTGEQSISEAPTCESLHHEIRVAPTLTDVEDFDHVRMRQPTYCPSLSLEGLSQMTIVAVVYPQQLHCHWALEE